MRKLKLLIAILGLLAPSVALAQSVSYLAIPSSGFTTRNSTTVVDPLRGTVETRSHTGNVSGTARFFGNNDLMFAPVNLPHGSKVISLTCSGGSPSPRTRVFFRLRRNEPQQANVDMALVFPNVRETNYQDRSTTSINSPVIDNRRFNYYIAASIEATNNIRECATCFVNRCIIAYSFPSKDSPRIKSQRFQRR
jgi:hypothetical protein